MNAERLLIIEDDPAIAHAMKIRLDAAGFRSQVMGDGAAGLAAAQQSPPDLILLDLRLPSLDGLTVLGELRRDPRTESIPVIVVSAHVAEETHMRALAEGAFAVVRKPYTPTALLAAVREALSADEPTREATSPGGSR